jgi:hypothetical protein
MVTADHGPAVSGAHNTIVCARAGKDLVSSLVSGLLTVVSISYLNGFILYVGFYFMEKKVAFLSRSQYLRWWGQ